jgi:hypothetical protein
MEGLPSKTVQYFIFSVRQWVFVISFFFAFAHMSSLKYMTPFTVTKENLSL